MYGDEPLCYSLTNTITPEVLRCFFLLRELFDSLDGTSLLPAYVASGIESTGPYWVKTNLVS